MKVGDLVRWKKTGKVCVYLGEKEEMQQFHSAQFGLVERWMKMGELRLACEVLNASG